MTGHDRWVVFVRGINGDAELFGIYATERAAQKKADKVNSLLPQDTASDAWAYVMPVYYVYATSAADIARRATT